jgi:hypothetical protein
MRHIKLRPCRSRAALNNETAIAALAKGVNLMAAALPRTELASLLNVSGG